MNFDLPILRDPLCLYSKRIRYLGISDIEYLSARYLILSGLSMVGYQFAAQSIEKLLKTVIVLASKYRLDFEYLESSNFGIGHNLNKIVKKINSIEPKFPFDDNILENIKFLRNYNKIKYPIQGQIIDLCHSADFLDYTYCNLRNNILVLYPNCDFPTVLNLGVGIFDNFSNEIIDLINTNNSYSPKQIFKLKNTYINLFNLNKEWKDDKDN